MCDTDKKLQCHTSFLAQTAQQVTGVRTTIFINNKFVKQFQILKTQVNNQTCSQSIFESQQFQVMIHLNEITIVL